MNINDFKDEEIEFVDNINDVSEDEIEFIEQPKTTSSVLKNKLLSSVEGSGDSLSNIASDTMSNIKDLGMGIAQGSTLGGAEEIGAGLQTLLAKIMPNSPLDVDKQLAEQGFKGDITPSAGEFYRQAENEEQARFKEAEERSPYLYGAGELGGAITTGIATGGAVDKVFGLGKVALKDILKNQGKQAFAKEVLKRGGVLGATGTVEGGIAGALGSEEGEIIGATPEQTEKLKADAAGGALMGGTLGLGGSVLADVVSTKTGEMLEGAKVKLDEFVEEKPFLRKLKEQYKMGKDQIDPTRETDLGIKTKYDAQGNPIVGPKVSQYAQNEASRIMDEIIEARNEIGRTVGKALDDAAQKGITIDLRNEIANAGQRIMSAYNLAPNIMVNPKGRAAYDRMVQAGGASISEIKAVLDDMDTIYNQLDSVKNKDTATELTMRNIADFRKQVSNKLKESIPEYKNASERFQRFNELVPETIISKDKPRDVAGVFFGNLKTQQQDNKLYDALIDLFDKGTAPGTSSLKGKTALTNVLDGLKQFELEEALRVNKGQIPNSALKRGAKEFEKDFQTISDKLGSIKLSMFERADSGQQAKGLNVLFGLGEGMAGTSMRAANIVGRNMDNISNVSKSVYKMPANKMNELAQKLKGIPGLKTYGEYLEEGLNSNNLAKRNAALFTIVQNPQSRMLISAEDLEETPEE
jgi:hypothetical protein